LLSRNLAGYRLWRCGVTGVHLDSCTEAVTARALTLMVGLIRAQASLPHRICRRNPQRQTVTRTVASEAGFALPGASLLNPLALLSKILAGYRLWLRWPSAVSQPYRATNLKARRSMEA